MLTSLKELMDLTVSSRKPAFEDTLIRWLCLNNVPQMGFIRLRKTAQSLGCSLLDLTSVDAKSLANLSWDDSQISAVKQSSKSVQQVYKATCKWLNASENHHFIGLDSNDYPALLKSITRPPLFLYVAGNKARLIDKHIAFVGTRKPSIYASQTCYDLIQELAVKTDASTVSGLALGVDAACHKASILHNVPTIGVLACGIDVVYPKRHQNLYKEVEEAGALISEFLPGAKPTPTMFPRRNRIITGLSLGTVVVEAKIKSGSMVSAKYAIEQNREVFAVPNNINNPNAEGCHWLIKQGAKLTEHVQDVIEELPSLALPRVETANTEKMKKNSQQHFTSDPLLDSVSYSATSVDLIAKRTGMSLSDVLTKLLEYEMRGLVASTAEGYVKLRA